MENHRDGGSEAGESGTTPNAIPQNFEVPRPNSRTRTSSEEELTLLSENADPNVQDPHQRNSIFWMPFAQSSNSLPRTRASTSAAHHLNNVPRRMRQNRPWTSRERYFNPFHTQQPYLYYRQYLRQEILRTYMARSSSGHRYPPPQFLTRIESSAINSGPACAYIPSGPRPNLRFAGVRIIPPIRYGVNSASSNSSSGSNHPSPPALNGRPQANRSSVEEEDHFTGLGGFDIMTNTRIIVNAEDHEDETCVICMTLTRKLELLRKLPCRHIFHKECIDKWLGFNGICPTCRRDIRLRRQSTPPAAH